MPGILDALRIKAIRQSDVLVVPLEPEERRAVPEES